MSKLAKSLAVITLAASATTASIARAADESAETVLAQHLDLTALDLLQSPQFVRPQVKYAEALYEIAIRLNPDEPSYLRQAGELSALLGETDNAIARLTAYAHKDPADRVTQVKIIELYVSRMQSVDAKIAYLNDILAKTPIAEDVRARAAVMLAKLYLERSQTDQAILALGQATRLNPLDPEANHLKLDLLPPQATTFERFRALLAIVKSNPTDAGAIDAVSQMMSSAGLVKESLPWYATGMNLHQQLHYAPERSFANNFASALFLSDQPNPANQIVTQILQIDSSDSQALFIKLAIDRSQPDNTAQYEKTRDEAKKAMTFRLAMLARTAGDTKATTQPSDTGSYTLPDMIALADRVRKSGNREWITAYAQWATDLAWLEIYYNNQPAAAAKTIDGLKHLTGSEDPVVARLEGWSYLVSGKPDEARVKLSAAQDRDALAALGIIQLAGSDAKSKEQADLLGRKILSEHPGGALGAQLYAALKPRGVQLVPGKTADAILEELKKFPATILNIAGNPGQFVALRAEPINSTNYYDQPIWARVSLQNLSDFDIPIGPDAALKGDIWFDAQTRGAESQSFAPALAGQIGQRLVLPAREGVSRTLRVDLGQFAQFLSLQPQISTPLSANVSSNLMMIAPGNFGIGPAGSRSPFSRMFERIGMNFTTDDARAKLLDKFKTASPGERMHMLQGFAAMVAQMKAASNSADFAPVIKQFTEVIDKTRSDSSVILHASATEFTSQLSETSEKQRLLDSLENEPAWQSKVVAALEAQAISPKQMQDVGTKLSQDSDPQIKQLGAAMKELADWAIAHPSAPATTQPAK